MAEDKPSRPGKPKGHPNVGGKPKDGLSAKSRSLHEKARELGIDPFEVLLYFAKGDWQALGYPKEERVISSGENGDRYEMYVEPSVRMQAAKEACSYLYPKLKSIEHSTDPEKPFLANVAVTPDLVKELVAAARAAKDGKPTEEM